MKKSHITQGIIFALTLGASAAVNGDVLYNNIPNLNAIVDNGPPPITARQYVTDGIALSNEGGYLASQFTIDPCAPDCILGNITLSMFSVGPAGSPVDGTTGFHLSVWSNDGSTMIAGEDPGISGDEMFDKPGTLITVLNNPTDFTSDTNYNVFTPNGTVHLQSRIIDPLIPLIDNKFWVVLSADSSAPDDTYATWSLLSKDDLPVSPLPNAGQPDLFILNTHSGAPVQNDFFTDPQLLMKVEVSPATVPVPGAAWLMGSVLLGLITSWRRKGGH
jgi:hypothetical protein